MAAKDFIATVFLGVEVRIDIGAENEAAAERRLVEQLESREYRLQLIKEAYINGNTITADTSEIECVGGPDEDENFDSGAKIKCPECGKSVPDVPEGSGDEATLCNECYKEEEEQKEIEYQRDLKRCGLDEK